MINAPRSAIFILKAGLDLSQCIFEANVFSKLEISTQLLLLYQLLQLDSNNTSCCKDTNIEKTSSM